jgi:hypothetical protein
MLRLHLRRASAGVLPARAAVEVYKGVSRAEPGGLLWSLGSYRLLTAPFATSSRPATGTCGMAPRHARVSL